MQFWILVLSVTNIAKIFVEAFEDYRRKRYLSKRKAMIKL